MDRSDRQTESPRKEDLCVCDELGLLIIDAMVMDMDKDLGIIAQYWGDGWDACGVARWHDRSLEQCDTYCTCEFDMRVRALCLRGWCDGGMHSLIATVWCVMQLPIISLQVFPINSETRTWPPRRDSHGCIAAALYATKEKKINDAMAGLVSSMRSDASENVLALPHSSADPQ
jgi:hypothetical protein